MTLQRKIISILFLLSVPQISVAQTLTNDTYVSGALGLSQPTDADLEGNGINTSMDSDLGYAASLAFGNAFDNNWRAEGELNYRRSGVDSIGAGNGAGNTSALGLMINGYYDFHNESVWTPYLGAGVGGASVSYNGVSPVGSSRIDDSDWAAAYQGIAGVNYKINDQASLFTEYRYVGLSGLNFRTDSGVNVDADSGENRIMVGFKWSFNKPKPMPVVATPVQAPAPAPKPAPIQKAEPVKPIVPDVPKNYLVFFDWNQSDLTPDVRAILAQAVANSQKIDVTRIQTIGHADRSGTDKYNLSLSQRRANAVQAELVRLGVAQSDIIVLWRGEQEPLVQTPDGVREPQNRRVEIILN